MTGKLRDWETVSQPRYRDWETVSRSRCFPVTIAQWETVSQSRSVSQTRSLPVVSQSRYVEGSVVGFRKGETVSFENLLYALLLPSGNDAALMIAQNYPGGQSAFVQSMNEKAKKYHLDNTHFNDPAGLDDDLDYTTVVDLARLVSIAMHNPTFARIVGTKNTVITTDNGQRSYELENLNKLLGQDGVVGVKTGTTEGAGEVLTTFLNRDGHRYVIIVMKSNDRFTDTAILIRHLAENIIYLPTHQ